MIEDNTTNNSQNTEPAEQVSNPAVTDVAVVEDVTETKDGKVKGILKKSGKKIAKNGKESVINFIIKKVITCLLTSIVSMFLVLFAQGEFKSDIKEYKEFCNDELGDKLIDVAMFIDDTINMEFDDIIQLYNDNDIYEKSKDLLRTAHDFQSDNAEINKVHNQLISCCEDLVDVSSMIVCTSAVEKQKAVNDRDYSSFAAQYLTKAMAFQAKMEVYKESRNELLKKYDLKINKKGEIVEID